VVCPVRAGMPVWAGMRSARRRIGVCTTFSSKISRCGPREFESASVPGQRFMTGLSNKRPGVSTGGTAAAAAFQVRRGDGRRISASARGGRGWPDCINTEELFRLCLCQAEQFQRPAGAGACWPGTDHTCSTVMATYSPCVYIKIIVRLGCRPSARGSYRPSDLAHWQPHGSGLTGLAGSCQWRGPGPGQRGYKLAFEKAGAGTRFLIATWHT